MGTPANSPATVMSAEELRQLWHRAWTENRPARIGLALSLIQLAGHITWIALTSYSVSTGAAARMSTSSPLAWTIVVILGLSMLLTLFSVFVCLFYGLRREPRLFAALGLLLSFFSGSFAFFALLLAH